MNSDSEIHNISLNLSNKNYRSTETSIDNGETDKRGKNFI